jgi:hypothetical protein
MLPFPLPRNTPIRNASLSKKFCVSCQDCSAVSSVILEVLAVLGSVQGMQRPVRLQSQLLGFRHRGYKVATSQL